MNVDLLFGNAGNSGGEANSNAGQSTNTNDKQEWTGAEFLKGIDPELLKEPAIKNIQDLPSLVKSYVHAQKMVGADKVVIPQKGATQEQWNEVFTKLGLPKKEEYKIVQGEKSTLSKDIYAKVSELAYSQGILPHQIQNLMNGLEEDAAARLSASQSNRTKVAEEAVNNLKKEWGEAFEAKLHNAREVIKKFGDEDTMNFIRETGLGADPRMLKLLDKIGGSMKEAKIIEGKDDSGSPQDLQGKLDGILKDRNHPYWNQGHVGHAAAKDEVAALFAKLY